MSHRGNDRLHIKRLVPGADYQVEVLCIPGLTPPSIGAFLDGDLVLTFLLLCTTLTPLMVDLSSPEPRPRRPCPGGPLAGAGRGEGVGVGHKRYIIEGHRRMLLPDYGCLCMHVTRLPGCRTLPCRNPPTLATLPRPLLPVFVATPAYVRRANLYTPQGTEWRQRVETA